MKDIDLGIMQKSAEIVIKAARRLMKRPDKHGGYLCIATRTGKVLSIFLVGNVCDETKASIYRGFCHEKALRLANNPEHISSWESRDERAQYYGGAICVNTLIFSFSGFSEHWDEACMITLAGLTGQCIKDYIYQRIREISGNPYSALLYRKLIHCKKVQTD